MTNQAATSSKVSINTLVQSISSNKVILTIVIILITVLISKIMRRTFNRLAEHHPGRRIQIKNFIPLLNILLYTVAAYIILFNILRFSKDVLMTLGVSAGVAVGLAAQSLLANIFSGLIIIFTRLFNIGDKIAVGDHYGEVIQISLTNVKIITPDDSVISIPSKQFLDGAVSNANSGELNCQVVTKINLPGNINLQEAHQAALEAAYSSPYLLIEKGVSVIFEDKFQNASLVEIKIKAYVADHRDEFKLSSDIFQRVKRWLAEEKKIHPGFYRIPSVE